MDSGSELRIILGSRHHCGTLVTMGIFGNEGENGIWGQAHLSVGPVGTQCGYFLSGGGKIELPCKLPRIRGTLLAWDFFRALQLKQITVASCSNMVCVV